MEKSEVIKKELVFPCYKCDGIGKTLTTVHKEEGIAQYELCDICLGSGKYVETFYYHIVNGICISRDTLK